jgi:hypothetical protein
MPGNRLLRLARLWVDPARVSNVLEPLVADWQRECTAQVGVPLWLCRVRGFIAFALAFLIVLGRTRRSLPLRGRAVGVYAAFSVATTAVLLLAYGDLVTTTRAVLLLPATLCLALPLAIVPASILLLATSDCEPHEVRQYLLRLSGGTTLAMLLLVGWVTPIANQMWREDTFARRQAEGIHLGSPARGVRELTLVELWLDGGADAFAPPRARAREKHARVIVALSPIVMLVVGLSFARRGRAGTLRAVLVWLAVPAVWLVVSSAAEAFVQAGGSPAALWLTPFVLVALAYVSRIMSGSSLHEINFTHTGRSS